MKIKLQWNPVQSSDVLLDILQIGFPGEFATF